MKTAQVKKGNTRKTGKEQYYTNRDVADLCVKELLKITTRRPNFLEPAGGKGDFIEALISNGVKKEKIISFDIEPCHPMVIKKDFLTINEKELPNRLVTISNPPFGRANSLSKKFFNKAAKFSQYIGFIVPKSWRKWSIQNSLDLNFELVLDLDLPEVCFYSPDGEAHTGKFLRCVFQVWKKTNTPREKIVIKDNGYITRVNYKNAEVALVIFGWSCGKLILNPKKEPNTTMMFLKVKNKEVIKALEKIDYSIYSNNVAYTQALSIQEINHLLNEYFK